MLDRQALLRIAPFALYMLALALEGSVSAWLGGSVDSRWLYAARAGLAAAAILVLFRFWEELKVFPSSAWLWLWAPAVGALVFVLWVSLDLAWLNTGQGSSFDPRQPGNGAINWPLAAVRLLGASLVVPLIEEIFWRSFLMRWIDRHHFLAMPPAEVSMKAMLVSSLVFGLAHSLWLAGFLAGIAYAWLYRASGSIWPSVVAHAITNALLGIWVLRTGSWDLW